MNSKHWEFFFQMVEEKNRSLSHLEFLSLFVFWGSCPYPSYVVSSFQLFCLCGSEFFLQHSQIELASLFHIHMITNTHFHSDDVIA